ncbi:Hypothetical predicted protein [Xyrichtys novacula]|uniref:Uncharacterized protein n=1 Tax=Xyrichtys novacula TaxID=13765 RepID=A0AAV1GJT5_XYRNO|nr:Hypothetical predicted protein [Xyrichtys novacula]
MSQIAWAQEQIREQQRKEAKEAEEKQAKALAAEDKEFKDYAERELQKARCSGRIILDTNKAPSRLEKKCKDDRPQSFLPPINSLPPPADIHCESAGAKCREALPKTKAKVTPHIVNLTLGTPKANGVPARLTCNKLELTNDLKPSPPPQPRQKTEAFRHMDGPTAADTEEPLLRCRMDPVLPPINSLPPPADIHCESAGAKCREALPKTKAKVTPHIVNLTLGTPKANGVPARLTCNKLELTNDLKPSPPPQPRQKTEAFRHMDGPTAADTEEPLLRCRMDPVLPPINSSPPPADIHCESAGAKCREALPKTKAKVTPHIVNLTLGTPKANGVPARLTCNKLELTNDLKPSPPPQPRQKTEAFRHMDGPTAADTEEPLLRCRMDPVLPPINSLPPPADIHCESAGAKCREALPKTKAKVTPHIVNLTLGTPKANGVPARLTCNKLELTNDLKPSPPPQPRQKTEAFRHMDGPTAADTEEPLLRCRMDPVLPPINSLPPPADIHCESAGAKCREALPKTKAKVTPHIVNLTLGTPKANGVPARLTCNKLELTNDLKPSPPPQPRQKTEAFRHMDGPTAADTEEPLLRCRMDPVLPPINSLPPPADIHCESAGAKCREALPKTKAKVTPHIVNLTLGTPKANGVPARLTCNKLELTNDLKPSPPPQPRQKTEAFRHMDGPTAADTEEPLLRCRMDPVLPPINSLPPPADIHCESAGAKCREALPKTKAKVTPHIVNLTLGTPKANGVPARLTCNKLELTNDLKPSPPPQPRQKMEAFRHMDGPRAADTEEPLPRYSTPETRRIRRKQDSRVLLF